MYGTKGTKVEASWERSVKRRESSSGGIGVRIPSFSEHMKYIAQLTTHTREHCGECTAVLGWAAHAVRNTRALMSVYDVQPAEISRALIHDVACWRVADFVVL